jgi:hypothetical protein
LADELLSNIPRATVRRTNAAVVGILGAALYNPVWTQGNESRLTAERAEDF